MFVGFLPDNKKQKRELLTDLKTQKHTLIFYSAPHNLIADIKELFVAFGDRQVCTVRELTKLHEEVEFFSLKDGYPKEPRGEYVVIVKGMENKVNELNDLSIVEHYEYYTKLGMPNNDAIKQVAKDMGVAKNVIYNHIVLNKKS
jgi:16S rRNA (cytidine1402-2'-O)-methyltransferase